jgi:hypothetical protein
MAGALRAALPRALSGSECLSLLKVAGNAVARKKGVLANRNLLRSR